MRTPNIMGLALAGLLAIPVAAQAGYVADGTMVQTYYMLNPHNAGTWRDRVGGTAFELFGVDIASSAADGGTINLSLYTNYGLRNETQFGTRTADIAFKLQGEDDFNHGLILYDHGTAARADTNTLAAGFYEVGDWKESRDVFGNHAGVTYSGEAADCTDNAGCNAAEHFFVDTYVDQGDLLVANNGAANGYTLAMSVDNNVTTPDGLFTALYRINIEMTGIGDLFGPGWEMIWGNATCANDTIHLTGVGIPPSLPEPAAMGLMLLGLVGLGASRRVACRA